jgi:YD repeat-containing protein
VSTVRVLYGELRTGKITGVIDATGTNWAQTLNAAGSIDGVTVPDDVLARFNLRQGAAAARCFLAVEIDDRIQEAGPIWSRSYDWGKGQATFGAAGLWSLFDHRKVVPVLAAGQYVQNVTTTFTGADLGDIARQLVAQAGSHTGGDLPIVLPAARPGAAHTESWPGWQLSKLGEQLTQLTQRQSAAPDIAFRPRRKSTDRRFIEWVMLTGTAAASQLSQGGSDWVFDTTLRRGPVLGIGTDEDATAMGMRGWETGNGTEASTLISVAEDDTLIAAGYPLLEQEENRSTVELQPTLDAYAAQLVARSARPVEIWKLTVHASAAAEVQAGDYAQVITSGHPWLGTGSRRMRVQKKSGDLTEKVVLDMYPLQATL